MAPIFDDDTILSTECVYDKNMCRFFFLNNNVLLSENQFWIKLKTWSALYALGQSIDRHEEFDQEGFYFHS